MSAIIQALICRWFHVHDHVGHQVYHSWDLRCLKCGREWREHD